MYVRGHGNSSASSVHCILSSGDSFVTSVFSEEVSGRVFRCFAYLFGHFPRPGIARGDRHCDRWPVHLAAAGQGGPGQSYQVGAKVECHTRVSRCEFACLSLEPFFVEQRKERRFYNFVNHPWNSLQKQSSKRCRKYFYSLIISVR